MLHVCINMLTIVAYSSERVKEENDPMKSATNTSIPFNFVNIFHTNCCSLNCFTVFYGQLVSCNFGIHDIIFYTDFGVDKLVKLAKTTNFPWLMSNVVDNLNNNPLADGITSHIIEWNGIKVSADLIRTF